MPRDRQATLFRTDPRVLAELDRIAQRLGVSRNAVLNIIVRPAVEAGVVTALTASGVRQATHVTGEDGR